MNYKPEMRRYDVRTSPEGKACPWMITDRESEYVVYCVTLDEAIDEACRLEKAHRESKMGRA